MISGQTFSPVFNPLAYNDRTISSTPTTAARAFHDLRGEAAVAVAGHVDLDLPGRLGQHCLLRPGAVTHIRRITTSWSLMPPVPQMRCHLRTQRRLENVLGELFNNPSGPVNDRPCSWAIRTNSGAASYSAEA